MAHIAAWMSSGLDRAWEPLPLAFALLQYTEKGVVPIMAFPEVLDRLGWG
jgi:hypothetical protein